MNKEGHRAPPRFDVLGVGVDAIDMNDALKVFEEAIERGGGHDYACALGVAGIMEARRNPEMRRILNGSLLNTPDGMPLVWLGKLRGYRNIRRVYGPDLLNEAWIKHSGFQWLHRALTDPRLWSRYLRDNPRFAVEALLQLCGLKKFPGE